MLPATEPGERNVTSWGLSESIAIGTANQEKLWRRIYGAPVSAPARW